jgi:hypothetical protein
LHTIACVFVPGNGFTEQYVYRLRNSLLICCREDHRFVCLTNERLADIETMPLRRSRNGWWNKLALFSAFEKAVYFDLDTMIVDDVTDIVTYPHTFTGLTDFGKGVDRFASGFMAWNGDFSYLDQDIDAHTEREYDAFVTRDWTRHGDQGFISEHLMHRIELTNDLFPGRFVSYKWHVRRQGFVPPGASVVCFHGKPRPADVGWRLP